MFAKIEGDQALLVQNGLYKPADLYEFDGGLYAKIGSGYARLKANGSTSKDGVMIKHLQISAELFKDQFERIQIKKRKGSKPFVLSEGGALSLT